MGDFVGDYLCSCCVFLVFCAIHFEYGKIFEDSKDEVAPAGLVLVEGFGFLDSSLQVFL